MGPFYFCCVLIVCQRFGCLSTYLSVPFAYCIQDDADTVLTRSFGFTKQGDPLGFTVSVNSFRDSDSHFCLAAPSFGVTIRFILEAVLKMSVFLLRSIFNNQNLKNLNMGIRIESVVHQLDSSILDDHHYS
jgi:hypothetical protein